MLQYSILKSPKESSFFHLFIQTLHYLIEQCYDTLFCIATERFHCHSFLLQTGTQTQNVLFPCALNFTNA